MALPAGTSVTTRTIAPVKRRVHVLDLARHAQVIRVMAARDFKAKYKQSLLGVSWVVIQPAGLLLGLILAFSHLHLRRSAHVPYYLFALTGLCVWSYFQAAMVMGTASIVGSFALVKRTPCPRLAFPVSGLLATTPTLAILLLATVPSALFGGHLSPRALLVPFAILWLFLLTGAVVATTSSVAVYFRDVLNALPLLLQIGIFVAPIGYTLTSLSGASRVIVELNPLTGLIEFWRWTLLVGYRPGLAPIVVALVETTILLFAGWWIFGRLETTMADRI